jgi:hypothetical protein
MTLSVSELACSLDFDFDVEFAICQDPAWWLAPTKTYNRSNKEEEALNLCVNGRPALASLQRILKPI